MELGHSTHLSAQPVLDGLPHRMFPCHLEFARKEGNTHAHQPLQMSTKERRNWVPCNPLATSAAGLWKSLIWQQFFSSTLRASGCNPLSRPHSSPVGLPAVSTEGRFNNKTIQCLIRLGIEWPTFIFRSSL